MHIGTYAFMDGWGLGIIHSKYILVAINNSRNQDSGKVFYLKSKSILIVAKHPIFRLLLTILANLPVPQHQAIDTA